METINKTMKFVFPFHVTMVVKRKEMSKLFFQSIKKINNVKNDSRRKTDSTLNFSQAS